MRQAAAGPCLIKPDKFARLAARDPLCAAPGGLVARWRQAENATMTAYVVVDIDVKDRDTCKDYIAIAPASVEQYGGKYLARAGATEVLEGEWVPKRLVILGFEDSAQAKAWLNSPEYRPARSLRHKATHSNMVVIEGA
jgi:uncharacterized protein (DUF1330 family)